LNGYSTIIFIFAPKTGKNVEDYNYETDWLFLIFLIAPLSIPKTAAQEIDSLKIFENITDIEKLIRQRQVQEAPPPQVVPGT
jgi:hypothetical protein